ncbi:MAG: alpha/beta hydrolase [Rickettsiales bacterium]
MRKSFSVLLSLLLTGCISLGTAIANVPSYFSGLEREADIAYGEEPWQKLDIYQIPTDGKKPKPVIVFFYGGRWEEGSKADFRFVANRFAKEGYLVVIPDYVKYPQKKFPAFVEDGARAVAWTKHHIAEYGGDASYLYVMGHSAGAHIGALIAADKRYLEKHGSSPKDITAFAGLAGPYAFTPEEDDLKDMFGPPENYPNMQVPTFIDGDEPPMLLLWGEQDSVVGKINIDRLVPPMQQHGDTVKTIFYPDFGHIGIIANLARSDEPVARDVIAFFKQFEK